jgi:hypothetical protein
MRKSIRWILFALAADSWQRDKLIDKDKKIKKSMRKSILLNVSSSKTIARFEAEFDVTKACFFVVVLSFTDLCVHWSVLISLRWWYDSSQYTVCEVYCWMMIRGFILSTIWWSISNVWVTCSLILFGKVTHRLFYLHSVSNIDEITTWKSWFWILRREYVHNTRARKRDEKCYESSSRRILVVDASNEHERWSEENKATHVKISSFQ